jgi:LPXTG-motif cell wall-anchored protein
MVSQAEVVMGAVMELSGKEGTSGGSMSPYILIIPFLGMAAIGAWLLVRRRKGKK